VSEGKAACPEGEVRASGQACIGRKVVSVLALLFLVALIAITVFGVLAVVTRKLSMTKHVAVSGRIDLVRAKARVDDALRSASAANARQMQATRLASEAIAVSGQALHVARQIDKVSGQLDELLASADVPSRGRHGRAGLRAVRDSQEGNVA
jgi:hypothetical protein